MQIRNNIYPARFIILTLINIFQYYFLADSMTPYVFAFFMFSILANQYFLAILVADMTGIAENTTLIPTWLLGVVKLLILIFGFYFAMNNSENKEIFLAEIYIFQLIILVLSTKRVVKKN